MPFDLDFLTNNGIVINSKVEMVDIMPIVAEQQGKRLSLLSAADIYHYDWKNGSPHDSVGDCYATLHIYKKLFKEED